MKNILINASNLQVGGAIQVAVWLIGSYLNSGGTQYSFLVSPVIQKQLVLAGITQDANVFVIDKSPARSLKARRYILDLESKIKPDLVYTIFGPAYVKFKSKHLMGFAHPWVIYANLATFFRVHKYRLGEICCSILRNIYIGLWARCATYWLFETESAKNNFAKRFGLAKERMYVISNCCADAYWEEDGKKSSEIAKFFKEECFNILYFSAYYPHKNHAVIPYVAKKLRELGASFKFCFYVTLKASDFLALGKVAAQLGVSDCMVNLGYINIIDGPSLYNFSSLCFIPSLLEVFSASYVEAMVSKVPLLVSNFDFAREVCADAAVYVDIANIDEIARKIIEIRDDSKLRDDLINKGVNRAKKFPHAKERFELYRQLIEQLC